MATHPRYVDFLRGLSILDIITGHWLISTAVQEESTPSLVPTDVLSAIPSTQWLTGLLQVMPVFLMVGGYANAISLESAKHRQINYAQWLTGRLHRWLPPCC